MCKKTRGNSSPTPSVFTALWVCVERKCKMWLWAMSYWPLKFETFDSKIGKWNCPVEFQWLLPPSWTSENGGRTNLPPPFGQNRVKVASKNWWGAFPISTGSIIVMAICPSFRSDSDHSWKLKRKHRFKYFPSHSFLYCFFMVLGKVSK